MDMLEAVRTVEASALFREWRAEHPDYYLSSVFMSEAGPLEDWQVAYYHAGEDRIVSFGVEPLKRFEPQEVFKAHGPVPPLDLASVKIDLGRARGVAAAILKDNFSGEQVLRVIVILQRLDTAIYNFTFVTKSFNVINLKIGAADGLLKTQNKHSVLDLGKPL